MLKILANVNKKVFQRHSSYYSKSACDLIVFLDNIACLELKLHAVYSFTLYMPIDNECLKTVFRSKKNESKGKKQKRCNAKSNYTKKDSKCD